MRPVTSSTAVIILDGDVAEPLERALVEEYEPLEETIDYETTQFSTFAPSVAVARVGQRLVAIDPLPGLAQDAAKLEAISARGRAVVLVAQENRGDCALVMYVAGKRVRTIIKRSGRTVLEEGAPDACEQAVGLTPANLDRAKLTALASYLLDGARLEEARFTEWSFLGM